MPKYDPRVDAYIAKSADFAQPILEHLRELIHEACPDCEETIKWGFPSFDYKGPFCSTAAFKAHCAFGFWKTSLIPDPDGILTRVSMGSLGKITSLKDLPSDRVLKSFIAAAKRLNDEGIKIPTKPKSTVKRETVVPDYILKALKKNRKALATFEAFSPSHRREYINWITEAKQEETKTRRINTMIEWLVEGKSRDWKYKKK